MESESAPSLQDGQRGPNMSPGNRHEGMDVVTIDPNAVSNTRVILRSRPTDFQAVRAPQGGYPSLL